MSEMVNEKAAAAEEPVAVAAEMSTKDADFSKLAPDVQEQVLAAFRDMNLQQNLQKSQRKGTNVDHNNHKFWGKQPVPQFMDEPTPDVNEPIDPVKTVAEIRQEPYNMPGGFSWSTMDVTDAVQLDEIYTLLYENYVEDDDEMFRFDYSRNFLLWALTPPGFIKDWHVGVRNTKTGKLMGFITGVPAEISVNGAIIQTAEINFLCVHKSLRSKRLAPVLIKEITRRVNLTDRWQAVYTAGVVLPRPVARGRYWHRSLNPKKLIEIKFSRLQPRMTMSMTIKLYKLADHPTARLRPMTATDVPAAHRLMLNFLQSSTKLHPVLNEAEFAHWILPREGVINSYVVENDKEEITDFCSFYHLPSSVINNPKHSTLNAAYSYYNVATSMPLVDLMRDCLIQARNTGSDVFNALDLMNNKEFLEPLKFGIGDGNLQYYLYNWKCAEMKSEDVGVVLLSPGTTRSLKMDRHEKKYARKKVTP